jgi:hypothetical protein
VGLRVFRADGHDDHERRARAGNVSARLNAWWCPSHPVGTEVLDETTAPNGEVTVWPWARSARGRFHAVWLSLVRLLRPRSHAVRMHPISAKRSIEFAHRIRNCSFVTTTPPVLSHCSLRTGIFGLIIAEFGRLTSVDLMFLLLQAEDFTEWRDKPRVSIFRATM